MKQEPVRSHLIVTRGEQERDEKRAAKESHESNERRTMNVMSVKIYT